MPQALLILSTSTSDTCVAQFPSNSQLHSMTSNEVYLVLGGDVFVGRHVVEQLKARGDTVFAFDSSQRHDDVECFPGDICVPEQVSSAIQKVISLHSIFPNLIEL
jgi:NAD(P)-dependent dehydrogenase (short-subunit alcohol dehydrogenase family)